ncbi:IS6 family transposase, partial [Marinovum sp. 2_MG-2023]|uniref:IS6 family transposase n=1 Tax=unclassified Marinovum TaxID=2647166 RepID=UPI0026E2F96C
MILNAVYFYVRFPVTCRDLEEIMAERGVDLDHATLNRWVEKYAGAISEEAYLWNSPIGRSWRMDETYVKVKGKWTYLYRAIDKEGKTLGFILSECRDEAAATGFFAKAVGNNGWYPLITVRRTKYLNNFIEQDLRFIKKIFRPMQT